jgi:hypothetical protein
MNGYHRDSCVILSGDRSASSHCESPSLSRLRGRAAQVLKAEIADTFFRLSTPKLKSSTREESFVVRPSCSTFHTGLRSSRIVWRPACLLVPRHLLIPDSTEAEKISLRRASESVFSAPLRCMARDFRLTGCLSVGSARALGQIPAEFFAVTPP